MELSHFVSASKVDLDFFDKSEIIGHSELSLLQHTYTGKHVYRYYIEQSYWDEETDTHLLLYTCIYSTEQYFVSKNWQLSKNCRLSII